VLIEVETLKAAILDLKQVVVEAFLLDSDFIGGILKRISHTDSILHDAFKILSPFHDLIDYITDATLFGTGTFI
jgi:hypothetical protein